MPLLLLAAAMPRPALAANGATAVDDTDIDPVGACKIDSWFSAAANRDRIFNASPGCVFNFGTPVDITAGFQRFRADDVWGSTASVKFRAFRIPAEGGRLSVLFSAGATYDFDSGEITTVLVNIPATFQLMDNLKLNVNGGWFYDRPNQLHWATWGASFDWSVNDRISLIGEAFGQLGHTLEDQPHLTDPRAQFVVRYKPNENIDFDVAYGRSITGVRTDWITVGMNVRFTPLGEQPAERSQPRPRLVRK